MGRESPSRSRGATGSTCATSLWERRCVPASRVPAGVIRACAPDGPASVSTLQAKDNERVTCFVENEAGGKFAIGSLIKARRWNDAVSPPAPRERGNRPAASTHPSPRLSSQQGKTDNFSLGKGLVMQFGSKARRLAPRAHRVLANGAVEPFLDTRAPALQVKFFHNGQHPVYLTGHLSEDEDVPIDYDRCASRRRANPSDNLRRSHRA